MNFPRLGSMEAWSCGGQALSGEAGVRLMITQLKAITPLAFSARGACGIICAGACSRKRYATCPQASYK